MTRRASGVTADQQKNNSSDLEITRRIRRAVLEDKSLSAYAHNVKVIAQYGGVILKRPVRSVEEKARVEAMAAEVVGQANVPSRIRVVPKRTTK